jgi:hypothetical protein
MKVKKTLSSEKKHNEIEIRRVKGLKIFNFGGGEKKLKKRIRGGQKKREKEKGEIKKQKPYENQHLIR